MKKMKFSLIAAFGLIAFLIGSCQNNPTNPNGNTVQNIIDSLGIDTNNTNCQFNYTYSYDSTNNIYVFNGQGSGVAPIQYVWVINQDTLYGQTVTVQGPVYDFCAAMLDDAGCFTSICDSIGSPGPGTCTTIFTVSYDSLNGTMTLYASGTGTAPFTYYWDVNGVGYTGSSITVPNVPSSVNLAQVDAGGCTASYTDSVGYNPTGGGCGVQAWAYVDSTGSNVVTAGATASGTAPFTYVWTVQGNSTVTYTGQNISWQGQAGTTYQACVTITDNTGCTSTDCVPVYVPL